MSLLDMQGMTRGGGDGDEVSNVSVGCEAESTLSILCSD